MSHEKDCSCFFCSSRQRIGFISTRIAGTDGVSLETFKWSKILEKQNFKCFYFAGELDTDPEISFLSERAHFSHPDIRKIFRNCFDKRTRKRSTTNKIQEIKEELKDDLYQFINQYNISLLIPQNALTIPLNIPLGLALTEVIAETGMPVIAHHHDFFWERTHFLTNAVWDYLNMAFPPHLPTIHHVVINSSADNQLGLRTGISSSIMPNVMDFDNPPPPVDEYASDVRQAFGVKDDEYFILQPTRVIKRKGIEHAIELVSRMGLKAKLIISHASGDEGYDYENRIREYSKLLNVDTIFVSKRIDEKRGLTKKGEKIYTLEDVYPHADLVTYPSNLEGFGNAFLEAIYFCKPIVVNTYSIYSIDIKPKGFKAIELDGYVTQKAVEETKKVLKDTLTCENMTRHNYNVARRFYSYSVLEKNLLGILNTIAPCTDHIVTDNNTCQIKHAR
jgi:glycosyltransferase involved in cell wall biosynthesis